MGSIINGTAPKSSPQPEDTLEAGIRLMAFGTASLTSSTGQLEPGRYRVAYVGQGAAPHVHVRQTSSPSPASATDSDMVLALGEVMYLRVTDDSNSVISIRFGDTIGAVYIAKSTEHV